MILHIVTGAPGAGKTTTIEAFLKLESDYMVFDIDWLIYSASDLAQRDIFTDGTTWPAYGRVWFDVLHMAVKNGQQPVFFTPNTPADLEPLGEPSWCSGYRWILLDCPDRVRRQRLLSRNGWDEGRIQEAFEDGAELRALIPTRLDTSKHPPAEIAEQLRVWLAQA